MATLPSLPPEYMEQQAVDRYGNPVTIAVRQPWAPPDAGPAPFLAPQSPSTLEQLRDPTLVPGGMSAAPQPTWVDELLSSKKSGVDTTGPTVPLGPTPDWLKHLNDAKKAGVDRPLTEEERTGAAPASMPGAARPSPAAFAPPPAARGTGGAGAAGLPALGSAGGFASPPGGGGVGAFRPAQGEKELRKAFEQEQAANQHLYDAGQKQATVEAGYAQQMAALAEKQRQEATTFEGHRQEALNAQLKSYQEAQDEVAKVNTTVDPNKFWASKGTGSKIVAAIGAAMGAFGASLGGGPNYAQQIIDKAVSDDIDAQKNMVEYQLKKGNEKVANQQTLYGMMRQRFGDDSTALAATQAASLGVIQKKLEAAKAGLGNDAQKAQLEALQAGVAQKQAGAFQQLRDKADDHAIRWAEHRRQERNDTLDYQAKLASSKAAGGANNKKAVEDIQQIEEKYRNIEQNTARLKQLIKENGTQENWTPGVRKEMDQLRAGLAVDMAKVKDPNSVVRESEMAGEMANIFDPGYLQRGENAQAGLDSFLRQARLRRRNAYAARGFQAPDDEDSKDKAVGFTAR